MERSAYIPALAVYGLLAFSTLLPGVVPVVARHARALAMVAITAHASVLAFGILQFMWGASIHEALSSVSLILMVWYCLDLRSRARAILAPLAVVLLGTALVVPQGSVAALSITGFSPWLPLHLGLMFAGLAGCAWSFVVGIAYLLVRWHLKNRRFEALGALPPLEVLDRAQYRTTLLGFVFLTLGIGVGGVWAATTLAEPWFLDAKVIFTLIVWAWYGVTLLARRSGVSGRWGAVFSIIGFSGMIFSILFVNLLISGWHGVVR